MNRPDNELLSAYLDGEVTADEQAEVERLLAASPEARRLLDELRALSATLQALPQEKLGVDLSDEILHAAQRQILTGQHEPPQPASRAVFTWLRGRFTRRSLAWPAVAVVMAIVVMLLERPQPERQRPVAVVPKAAESREKVVLEDTRRELDREPPRLVAPSEATFEASRPGWERADEKPGQSVSGADQTVRAEKKLADTLERSKADPLSGTAGYVAKNEDRDGRREGVAPNGPAAGPSGKWRGDGQFSDYDSAGKADSPAKSSEQAPGEKKLAMGALPGGAKAGNGEGVAFGGGHASGGMAMKAPARDTADEGRKAQGGVDVSAPNQDTAPGDAGVLVVQCDLDADFATTETFTRLLAENRIAFADNSNVDFANLALRETDGLRGRTSALNDHVRGLAKNSGNASAREDNTAAGESVAGVSAGDNGRGAQNAKQPQKTERAPNADGLDLVYVEATTTQINAVLASMAKAHELYYSVSVEPAPGAATQEQFRTYSRRGGQERLSQSRVLTELERGQTKESGEKAAAMGDTLQVADGGKLGRAWRIAALNPSQQAGGTISSRTPVQPIVPGMKVLEEDLPNAGPDPTQIAATPRPTAEPLDRFDNKHRVPKGDMSVASAPTTPAPPASTPAPLAEQLASPSTPPPLAPQVAPPALPNGSAPGLPANEPAKPADDMIARTAKELAADDSPKPAARPTRTGGDAVVGQATAEAGRRPSGAGAGVPEPAAPAATAPIVQAVQPEIALQTPDELEKKTAEQPMNDGWLGRAEAPLPKAPAKPVEDAAKLLDTPAEVAKGVGRLDLMSQWGMEINGTANLKPIQAQRGDAEPLQRVLFVLRAVPNQARINASLAAPAAKAADPARPQAAEMERHVDPPAESRPASK